MKTTASIVLTLAALMMATTVYAEDGAIAQGKKTFEKNKDSVVYVTAAVKYDISGGGRSAPTQEMTVAATGTVIDPSGLVVLSFTSFDPAARGGPQQIGGQVINIEVKNVEHTNVKIVLANGDEVPADVVLKDPILDLVFVMAKKDSDEYKAAKWTAVKFEKAPKVQVLDNILCIGRMARSLNQEASASVSEVNSVVTKPRTLIIGGKYLGCPVFAMDGTPVGLTVMHKIDVEGSKTQQPVAVIVPAEEVAKVAEQAKTATPIKATTTSAPATSAPASEPAVTK